MRWGEPLGANPAWPAECPPASPWPGAPQELPGEHRGPHKPWGGPRLHHQVPSLPRRAHPYSQTSPRMKAAPQVHPLFPPCPHTALGGPCRGSGPPLPAGAEPLRASGPSNVGLARRVPLTKAMVCIGGGGVKGQAPVLSPTPQNPPPTFSPCSASRCPKSASSARRASPPAAACRAPTRWVTSQGGGGLSLPLLPPLLMAASPRSAP